MREDRSKGRRSIFTNTKYRRTFPVDRLDRKLCNFSMVLACFCHLKLRTLAHVLLGILAGFAFATCLRSLAPEPRDAALDAQTRGRKCQLSQTTGSEPIPPTSIRMRKHGHSREVPKISTDRFPDRELVFIGIMTAEKYLSTRAVAINQTWGSQIPGRLKFFVGHDVPIEKYSNLYLPLVRLKHVTDATYPPQKKSFLMLKYMWTSSKLKKNHGESRFDWFLRADDDAYIRGDKLEMILRSLSANEPIYLGQTGLGNREEYGHLSLGDRDNYCMGGTSMILSREALRRMVSHVGDCLSGLFTNHEDVEVGRCVRKFAGVSCTWAYENQKLFYNAPNASSILTAVDPRRRTPSGSSLTSPASDLSNIIVVHPAKDPVLQRVLHLHFRRQKAADLIFREIQLSRDLAFTSRTASPCPSCAHGSEPSLLPFHSTLKGEPAQVFQWSYVGQSCVEYCASGVHCPRHNLAAREKATMGAVAEEVLASINRYARQRGRILEYQETLYGYQRFHPSLGGAQYVVDLLLMYKKFKGKRMNVPVRRHAYVQQTFGRLLARDATADGGDAPDMVHVIIPLKGRLAVFRRFLTHFESEILAQGETSVSLRIVHFRNAENPEDPQSVKQLIDNLRAKFPSIPLTLLAQPPQAAFSRGYALTQGLRDLDSDALLLLTDVDVLFTRDFLTRLRFNVQRRKRAYFPVVFSEYRPPHDSEWPEHLGSPEDGIFDEDRGYFRNFGYGILAIYKSDLSDVGGYDMSIRSWGYEDVDLYERVLKRTLAEPGGVHLAVLRAPDPGLVHVYHDVICNTTALTAKQLQMCKGSQRASLASQNVLAKEFLQRRRNRGG